MPARGSPFPDGGTQAPTGLCLSEAPEWKPGSAQPASPQALSKEQPPLRPGRFPGCSLCLTSQWQEALSSAWVKEARATVGRDKVESWPRSLPGPFHPALGKCVCVGGGGGMEGAGAGVEPV